MLSTLIKERTLPKANPRLGMLAEWNMEDNDDTVLNLYFGSTWAYFPYREINSHVVSIYRNGYCAFLALAIHEQTNYPLAVFSLADEYLPENEGWLGHVAVKIGDDSYLDITGVSTAEQIQSAYGFGKYRGEYMSETIASTLEEVPEIFHPELHGQPWNFLEELEELVTRDYAEQLVARYVS